MAIIANYIDELGGTWDLINQSSVTNISAIDKAESELRAAKSDYSIMKNFYLVVNSTQQIKGPLIKTIKRIINYNNVGISVETRQFQMVNDLIIYNIYLVSDQDRFISQMTGASMELNAGEIHQLNLEFAIL